jgi:hypothetical protein
MRSFLDFANASIIEPSLKAEATDPKVIDGHHFYVNIVNYLRPFFPSVPNEKSERIALSGYLYFRFLLLFDNFIDESKGKVKMTERTFHKLMMAFEFYEKSVRGLSDLFDESHSFWGSFALLKKEYFAAIIKEIEISATKKSITEEDFELLAAGKSSICNATIYALSYLENNDSNNSLVIECIRRFHIGIQYADDVEDFRKDVQEGQWTYVQSMLRDYLGRNELVITDTNTLYKHLFVSGIARYSIEKAINHFDQSIKISQVLKLKDLTNLLLMKRKTYQDYVNELDLVIQKTKIKTTKRSELRLGQSIEDSIIAGTKYLEENLGSDFMWADFLTSAGFGKSWITAYVGFQLSEVNPDSKLLGMVLDQLLTSSGSSFNDSIIDDGDSTTFKMGFMNRMQKEIPTNEMRKWLSFMNKDGSWVTYRDEKSLRNRLDLEAQNISVGGWLTSKLCITASSAYVLSQFDNMKDEYTTTCSFLFRNLQSNISLSSYWWTSPVYATSFSIMALSSHPTFRGQLKSSVEWLKDHQQEQGYWKNEMLNVASPFYTALALKALLLFDSDKYQDCIQRGVTWIIQNQVTDGSWLTNRILRIPATDVEDPLKVSSWRLSSLGVNCVADDHNRVFTASTVVNMLGCFYKIHKNDIDVTLQYKANAEKPSKRVSAK